MTARRSLAAARAVLRRASDRVGAGGARASRRHRSCGRSIACSSGTAAARRAARGPYVPKGPPYPRCAADRAGHAPSDGFRRARAICAARSGSTACTASIWRRGAAAWQRVVGAQQPSDARRALGDLARLGIPQHQQVDNEMVFYGSRAHPRGMGPLIRLCLPHERGAVVHSAGRTVAQWRRREIQRPAGSNMGRCAIRCGASRALRARQPGLRRAAQRRSSLQQTRRENTGCSPRANARALALSSPAAPRRDIPCPKPEQGTVSPDSVRSTAMVASMFLARRFGVPGRCGLRVCPRNVDVTRQRWRFTWMTRPIEEHPYRLR